MEKFVVKIDELPKLIELQGNKGESKIYLLKPGGRKFGIHLNAVDREYEKYLKANMQK